MSRAVVITCIVGVAAIAGGLALAQEGRLPRVRRVDAVLELPPERAAELRAVELAARPPGAAQPEPALGPPFELIARIERLVDQRAEVSVEITPEQQARSWGLVTVRAREDVGDNMVFDGRLFTSYAIAEPGLDAALAPQVGATVALRLARRADASAVVVGWRRP